jgi:hypothetical protein
MAYDWGAGLQGGLGGAAAGSVFGPLGTVIGGGLGLLGGFGKSASTEQLNPYTDQYWDLMSGNLDNYHRQQQSAMGMQTAALGGAQNYYRQLGAFSPTATYDPSAATRMTMSMNPRLQRLARESMGDFQDAETLQRNLQRQAQTIAGEFNQLGGFGSGAFAKALGEGAANVAGQYNIQQDQRYQQAYMQLLQQQQQMNMAGVQGAYGAAAQRDQMRMAGLGGAAEGMLGIGGQYGQRASMFGNMAGQASAGLGSISGAEYLHTPAQAGPDIGGTLLGIAALDQGMRGPYGEGAGLFGNFGRQATPTPTPTPTTSPYQMAWEPRGDTIYGRGTTPFTGYGPANPAYGYMPTF